MRILIPGWLSSRDETTPVFSHFLVTVYMVWQRDEFIPGWTHPGSKDRDEITTRDGNLHVNSALAMKVSCKHSSFLTPGGNYTLMSCVTFKRNESHTGRNEVSRGGIKQSHFYPGFQGLNCWCKQYIFSPGTILILTPPLMYSTYALFLF